MGISVSFHRVIQESKGPKKGHKMTWHKLGQSF